MISVQYKSWGQIFYFCCCSELQNFHMKADANSYMYVLCKNMLLYKLYIFLGKFQILLYSLFPYPVNSFTVI